MKKRKNNNIIRKETVIFGKVMVAILLLVTLYVVGLPLVRPDGGSRAPKTIWGYVKYTNGAVIVGASVVVSALGYPSESDTTNYEGVYQVDVGTDTGTEWPTGTSFTVTATKDGYQATNTGTVSGSTIQCDVTINYPPDMPNTLSGPTTIVIGESGTYSTSGTDPYGDQVQYRFDWGDGIFSNWTSLGISGHMVTLSYSWSSAGTYVVKAQTRDQYGLVNDWSNGLTVIVSSDGPFTLSLTTSGTGNGSIEAYPLGPYESSIGVMIWANASIGSTFWGFSGHLNGTTTPESLIIDGDKIVNAEFELITNKKPIAGFYFKPDKLKTGYLVNFNSTSYDLDGYIVNWSWDFGDGNMSYFKHPTHKYFTAGNYTVCLTVMDDDGSYGSISKKITIRNNTSPMILQIYPVNNSLNVSRPVSTFNVSVFDIDNDLLIVYLRWINHSGLIQTWENLTCLENVTNESYEYTVPVCTDWIWGNTTYIWSVNVTDGFTWTNETYSFTTGRSRYDVTNDNKVNYMDALMTWAHRTNNPLGAPYDGLYDVNGDRKINYVDALLVWANRGLI